MLLFIEVCRYLYMHSCLKVLPQRFNENEVWTLQQHFDYFLFQPFAAVLGIIVLFSDLI